MQVSFLSRAIVVGSLVTFSAFPAFAAGKDSVVAVIGQEKITLSDLEAEKAQIPQLGTMPMEAVYQDLLDRVVSKKILLDKAKKDNIQNDPEVKRQIAEVEKDILRSAWLMKEVDKKVTDDKIKAQYDEFVKSFKPEEEIRARHILVDSEDKAKEILKKLKAGESFETLAKENSTDGSAANGGDLGFFRKGMMIPAFADAAFAIKAGEISKAPVKTDFGWHIIKVEERRMSSAPKLEEVREPIRAEVAQKIVGEVIETLQKDAKVQLFNLDGSPQGDGVQKN